MKTNSPAVANINLAALKHNLLRVKESAPQSRVISVIKANAYGHGLFPVADALMESDAFAVARLDEALALREHLSGNDSFKEIIILEGVSSLEDYSKCLEFRIIPVIHCLEQLQWLHETECTLEYWLKIDTGMHRLGLTDSDFGRFLAKISKGEVKQFPSVVMSHFACADAVGSIENESQVNLFEQKCSYFRTSFVDASFNPLKSLSNSAAILSIPNAHYDWVRPGIMLYGVSPFETEKKENTGLDENLKPVMTLSSEIISIKKLEAGDCIGYGATWCCPKEMTVAVIAIGYGDGYPRHAVSGTPVLIHDTEVPLVGRVSMDMITVDLSALEEQSIPVKIGDRAILWGEGLPIEKVSQNSGTIAYELLCQITQRVRFKYE